jgi:hypothetical protein
MSAKRSKLLDRIRSLCGRTVDRGFTEAEALAAAEKVAALLAENDLTLDEVEIRASPVGREAAEFEGELGERIWKVAAAIAELTGTRYWTGATGVVPVRITFFGLLHEAQIAGYLLDICARAMRCEAATAGAAWALYRQPIRRRRRAAFLDGMADALGRRILTMRKPQPAGRGLIVLREQIVDEEIARLGLRIRDMRSRSSDDFDPAYGEGKAAADRVALDPGLTPPQRASALIESVGR